ncbi:MAG: Flp family type IVb pilin [Novosphingobium sp.]
MRAIVKRLFSDQRGTSAIEYGLICAMVVLASLTALQGLSDENNGLWSVFTQKSQDAIQQANGSAS